MKIAAAVILYNPSPSVPDHIRSYRGIVGKVLVFDNSEHSLTDIRKQVIAIDNCEYFADEQNLGIAVRLNQAAKIASESGFDWLLTMDQDSFFDEESLSNYISCIENFETTRVAMFGVNYTDSHTKSDCAYEEVNQLITSGSLLNLKLFSAVGGFDEELFIDQVDHEYCYRAKLKGFRIVRFENIFLHHSLGETANHRSLKTLKQSSRSLHSPIRLYYMTRNALLVKERYAKAFPDEISQTFADLRIRIKNNLLYGKQRFYSLKMIIRGVRDHKHNQMGKLKI